MARATCGLLPVVLAALGLALPFPATAANLLPNSSFEAGIDSRLAIGRWYVAGLSALTLDAETPVHGQYSLRLPYSRIAYSPTPRSTTGIQIRSASAVRVSAGQLYSLTAWVRSDVPVEGTLALLPSPPDGRGDAAPVASSEVLIGRDWRRIGLSFRPAEDQDVYWDLAVLSERPGALWLDALQLEPGRPTPYGPARPVEAGIAVPALGAIFTAGETPRVTMTAFNGSAAAVSQAYRLRVLDLQGDSVHAQELSVELPAAAGTVREVSLPSLRNGVYKVLLTPGNEPVAAGAAAGSAPESEAHLAVLPPRRSVSAAAGAFGAAGTLAPEPLRILSRAGFTWLMQMTSNSRLIYWDAVEPFPGKFLWYDDDVQLAQSLGFGLMFNLEPCKTPAWAKSLSREQRIERWSRYVNAMATHYGNAVRHWTIADEVSQAYEDDDHRHSCWRSAEEYIPWHEAGARALHAADPAAKVMLNVDFDHAEALLKALPPGSIDILSDNAWHVPKRMERWPDLMSRYGYQEIWATGVAVVTPPWYAGHRGTKAEIEAPGFWADRNREVANGVVRTLAMGARRIMQYTATYVGNTNQFSLFEADSSLRPIGVQFASLIWLLDGSVRASKVPTGRGEGPVEIYRVERADGKVVYPLFGPPAAAQTLRLSGLAAADFTLYDHFANRLTVREGASGGLELPVGRDPVFLMTTSEAAVRVDRALAGLALRLDALPDAERVEQAGDYAILHGYRDGLWRPKPNVSLWYRSAARGWIELLRYRASAETPTYRVTPDGFEIDWRFKRSAEAFFLEPGQLPAGLMAGATLLGSRPGVAQLEWQASRVDAAGTGVISEPVGRGPAGISGPLTLLLQGPEPGFTPRLRTTLVGDPALFGEQPVTFGGWRLLAATGADYYLHQYYPAGPVGPVEIRVRLDVLDKSD